MLHDDTHDMISIAIQVIWRNHHKPHKKKKKKKKKKKRRRRRRRKKAYAKYQLDLVILNLLP